MPCDLAGSQQAAGQSCGQSIGLISGRAQHRGTGWGCLNLIKEGPAKAWHINYTKPCDYFPTSGICVITVSALGRKLNSYSECKSVAWQLGRWWWWWWKRHFCRMLQIMSVRMWNMRSLVGDTGRIERFLCSQCDERRVKDTPRSWSQPAETDHPRMDPGLCVPALSGTVGSFKNRESETMS